MIQKNRSQWTKEEDEFLIKNFMSLQYKEIALILNKSERNVSTRVKFLGFKKRKIIEWTLEDEKFLIENYKKINNKKIASLINKTKLHITIKCKELNIYQENKYKLNENFFKIWTADMAYILGFIYADGYLKKNNKCFGIGIGLSSKDRYILEKFLNKLECNCPIFDFKKIQKSGYISDISKIEIYSNKFSESLEELGVIKNKSCIITWPEKLPEIFKYDFIRGFMDGDGCVGINYRKDKISSLRLAFVGGETFLKSLLKEINKDFNTKINFSKTKFIETKNTNFGKIEFTKDTKNILDKIYENVNNKKSELFLKRKYEIYLKFKEYKNESI